MTRGERAEARSSEHDLEMILKYRQDPSPQLQEQLYLRYQGLIHFLASKFADRGEPLEDLRQVAGLGLLKALERFDAERGFAFTSFATPTIVGEIKRYFRDKSVLLKMPRHLQEVKKRVATANERLAHEMGRSPTIAELAEAVGISREIILQAFEADAASRTVSFDSCRAGAENDAVTDPQELLGVIDLGFDEVENRVMLERALSDLTLRDRVIVYLRFHRTISQSEIARFLGISQMQISRLQARALLRLRESLAGGGPDPPSLGVSGHSNGRVDVSWRGAGGRSVRSAGSGIRETVLDWMLHEAGREQEPRRMGAASARLYRKFRGRLSQVIGQAGADAILARAWTRFTAALPGGVEIPAFERGGDGAARLEALLDQLEPGRVQETAATFFVTFWTLLSTFIGERLALEILQDSDDSGLSDDAGTEETRS